MTVIKRYSCKNCGSIFIPSLRAEFEHIKVLCAFCDYAAALVPVPDWETPQQWEERTGKPWPDNGAVYYRCYYIRGGVKNFLMTNEWREHSWGELRPQIRKIKIMKDGSARKSVEPGYDMEVVIATEAGPPPDDWKPEEDNR